MLHSRMRAARTLQQVYSSAASVAVASLSRGCGSWPHRHFSVARERWNGHTADPRPLSAGARRRKPTQTAGGRVRGMSTGRRAKKQTVNVSQLGGEQRYTIENEPSGEMEQGQPEDQGEVNGAEGGPTDPQEAKRVKDDPVRMLKKMKAVLKKKEDRYLLNADKIKGQVLYGLWKVEHVPIAKNLLDVTCNIGLGYTGPEFDRLDKFLTKFEGGDALLQAAMECRDGAPKTNLILLCYHARRNRRAAVELFTTKLAEGTHLDSQSVRIIRKFFGTSEGVVRIFMQTDRAVQPDVRVFNRALRIGMEDKVIQAELARAVLAEMHFGNVAPDAETYIWAMAYHYAAGEHDAAEQFYRTMRGKGFHVNAGDVARACFDVCEHNAPLVVADELLKKYQSGSSGDLGDQAKEWRLYKWYARACIKSGKPEKALEGLQDRGMRKYRGDERVFPYFLEALLEAGETKTACDLIGDRAQFNSRELMEQAAHVFVRAGQYRRAHALITERGYFNFRRHEALIELHDAEKDVVGLVRIAHIVAGEDKVKKSTYILLIRVLLRRREYESLSAVLEVLANKIRKAEVKLTAEEEKELGTAEKWSNVLQALVGRGDHARAVSIYSSFRRVLAPAGYELSTEAMAAVMDATSKVGNAEHCEGLFEDVKARNGRVNAGVHKVLIQAYANQGKIPQMINQFSKMMDDGHVPSEASLRLLLDA